MRRESERAHAERDETTEAATANRRGIHKRAELRERLDLALENWHPTKVRRRARSSAARLAMADEAVRGGIPPGASGEQVELDRKSVV